MSAPAVILSADEYAALLKRIEGVERLVADRAPATAREFLTPNDVRKLFGISPNLVYQALESGRLKAEQRPGKGRAGRAWRIQPEDARTWYATFVAAQPGRPAAEA